MIEEQEALYTIKEIVEMYRFPIKTLRRLVRDGTIEAIKINGTKGGWRITKQAFSKYLETLKK